jgi:hemerythrin
MEWKHEYSTGIQEIDDQHKTLLAHFSGIEQASLNQEGWDSIHYKLLSLRQFTEFHFKFEEAVMRMFGFPDIEQHRIQHQYYLNKIDSKLQKSITNEIRDEVVTLLKEWIVEHICKSDQEYVRHIKSGAAVVMA